MDVLTDHIRAVGHRIKLVAEIKCACTDFANSRASYMQIGDKIYSATFSSLTVATTAVAKDVLCMVLLVRWC